MTVVRLLLQAFPARVVTAIMLGVLAGLSGAALISTIAIGLEGNAGRVVLVFVCAVVARVVLQLLASVQLLFVANDTVAALRIRLARSILGAPLRKVETIGGPRLLAALTEDAQVIGNAASSIVTTAGAVATIVGALAYLVWLSPAVGTMLGAGLAVAALIYNRFNVAGARAMQRALGTRRRMFGALSSSVGGLHELKLHRSRRDAFVRDAVSDSLRVFHGTLIQSFRLFAWAESLNLTVFFVAASIIVFAWPFVSPSAATHMPAYVLALLYIPAPFELVLEQLPSLAQANATVVDLRELGLLLDERGEPSAKQIDSGSWATLELRGVIHAFRSEDGRPFSLGPIDLTFKPGEVVYVMGGNGSGKTTLIKLLLSLYTPEAGEILVDGRAVAAEDVAGYRERFAAVLADYRVFEELYGVASTTRDADARALLERLSLADRVQVREGAWSTRDLSEGQRARLALVAALLRDRSIYVFDEWAAHQDPEFKSVFYESILPELKARGKTVVAVTHDDRFAHLADRIVRLEEGKVLAR